MNKYLIFLLLCCCSGCGRFSVPYSAGWRGYEDGHREVIVLKAEQGYWVQSQEGEEPKFVPKHRLHINKYE